MDVNIQISRYSTKEQLVCGANFLMALSESARTDPTVETTGIPLSSAVPQVTKVEEAPVAEDTTVKAKKKATKKAEPTTVETVKVETPAPEVETEPKAEVASKTNQEQPMDSVLDEEIADFKNYIRDSIAKLVKLKKITSEDQFVSRVVALADNKKMIDLTSEEFTALKNATIDLVKGFIDGTL